MGAIRAAGHNVCALPAKRWGGYHWGCRVLRPKRETEWCMTARYWHGLFFASVCVISACSDAKAPSNSRRVEEKGPAFHRAVYSPSSIVPNGASRLGIQETASLAPGRVASVYGEHLGPETPCTGTADPAQRETPNRARPNQTQIETQVFPTTLCRTEVRVGGILAGLLYVSAGQINFKVPQQTPVEGTTEVQVFYQGHPGPVVVVPLGDSPVPSSAEQLTAEIWSGLKRVEWENVYPKTASEGQKDCSAVPVHPNLRRGLYGHAYYCSKSREGVVAETFYYPVDPVQPKVLLRRADFRLAYEYPEMSAEVEQMLVLRLTDAYGPGSTTDHGLYEIGVGLRNPGRSWQIGDLTIFLHRNRNHVSPAGVREGVQLIAVRREVLEERQRSHRIDEAFQTSARLSRPVIMAELEKELPGIYFTSSKRPEIEAERVKAERDTQAALLRLLREASEGDRSRRAAVLVAADDLAVRLGGLLVIRSVTNGSESIAEEPGADRIRRQLVPYGVRYTGPGHYSGDLEYDRILLRRAWKEFPETPWGQRAFLLIQRDCSTPELACRGPNCFLSVIRQGEKFLQDYPDTPFRTEQIYHLALAYDTWWSLSQAGPNDPTAEGAQVNNVSGERARMKAIGLYEELIRVAGGSPEAQAGQLSLPRLKLGLATGERTFFCVSC